MTDMAGTGVFGFGVLWGRYPGISMVSAWEYRSGDLIYGIGV